MAPLHGVGENHALPVHSLPVPADLLEGLAQRVAELVTAQLESQQPTQTPWLDVPGVMAYAVMTEQAVRDATKRGQLKSYRTTTGRVRYRIEDVEAFLRGEA